MSAELLARCREAHSLFRQSVQLVRSAAAELGLDQEESDDLSQLVLDDSREEVDADLRDAVLKFGV